MTIELWDMDMPYELQIDCNDEGKKFVRIMPNSAQNDRDTSDYDLCLDYDQCMELSRVLRFMANEIKK